MHNANRALGLARVLLTFDLTAAALVGCTMARRDFVGRWGGEEFLVVAPQTGVGTAPALVERLRDEVERTSFDDAVPGLRITFSTGVSECAPGEDLSIAIERADDALYEAKHAGRDRTVSRYAEAFQALGGFLSQRNASTTPTVPDVAIATRNAQHRMGSL